eukprot:CAMPEP_0204821072 /NCGR_PEP_ID=MMETSP1018-20131115/2161_1 /ASSEMBLY_ACC=CAM_ASM_000518 /TAXON_ID=46462 /ORGANISM="Anophryoides haemophila, Strain AH6" /LENGTH=35 /DNA_ID= /DNA_START= /DNA_END= /DNA_ORIENTATION=
MTKDNTSKSEEEDKLNNVFISGLDPKWKPDKIKFL